MKTISSAATAASAMCRTAAPSRISRKAPLEHTKNPLDVAIDGNGFLVVQTPAGERYTRDGGLQINNQGQLVNASGHPVLGTSGPIVFQPTDKDVTIAADGNVTVLEGTNRINSVRGKLRLVNFADAAEAGEGRLQPLLGRRRRRRRSPTSRRRCARASSRNPTSIRWSR